MADSAIASLRAIQARPHHGWLLSSPETRRQQGLLATVGIISISCFPLLQVKLEELEIQRILFGFFPTYR